MADGRRDLAIIGAGGIAREIASWAEQARLDGDPVRVTAFVDDPHPGRELHGRPVVRLAELDRAPSPWFVVAVGSPALRRRLAEEAEAAGLRPAPALVHPGVVWDRPRVQLGVGTVVCPGTILTTDVTVGRHVQINLQCSIGHDARLEDLATLSPGVHVSGWVTIGAEAFLGTGAVTVDGREDRPLRIGAGATVGAGAVVTRDVAPGTTVVGVPARPR
jgi:sugar O-acyltransferase (sialic acid O-acetyltransferase NeuD family)